MKRFFPVLTILFFASFLVGWLQVVPINEDVPSAGGTDYTQDANCRGAWLFADDYTDESGEGNTLSTSGDPTFSTERPSGFSSGKSVLLDGNDYLDRAHADLSANFPGKASKTDWTIAFWIKRSNTNTGYYDVLGKQAGYRFNMAWIKSQWHELNIKYNGSWSDPIAILNNTNWRHIVVVCDGSETDFICYVDGGEANIINGSSGAAEYDSPFLVGDTDVQANMFQGYFYQLIIFDRVLDSDEAGDLYSTGITGEN